MRNGRILLRVFILSCALCGHMLFAQQRKIDSLRVLLQADHVDSARVTHLNLLSRQYITAGAYDSALYCAAEALRLCDQLLSSGQSSAPPNNLLNRKAAAMNDLGVAYHMQSDYVKALDHYFGSLAIAEKTGDKNRIATQMGNIGLIYADQGEYPKALNYYFKVLKMSESVPEELRQTTDKNGISRYLGNIGAAYHHQAKYKEALEYYTRALLLKEELGDKSGIARYEGNIGLVYKEQAARLPSDSAAAYREKLYQQALDRYFKALHAFEELGERNRVAGFMGNIGALYTVAPYLPSPAGEHKKGYALAEQYLLGALQIAKEIESLREEMDMERNLSDLYTKTDRYQAALEHYKKSMEIQNASFTIEKDKQLTRKTMSYEFEKREAAAKLEQDKKDNLARAELAKREQQRNYFIIGFVAVGLLALLIFRGYRQKQQANIIITQQKLEVEKKNLIIEAKNKDILDSIEYAKRIQTSLMPTQSYIERNLKRLRDKTNKKI